jgi:hypothetical protein
MNLGANYLPKIWQRNISQKSPVIGTEGRSNRFITQVLFANFIGTLPSFAAKDINCCESQVILSWLFLSATRFYPTVAHQAIFLQGLNSR